jgi:hypothetical protein
VKHLSREQQAISLADDLQSLLSGHLSERAFRTKYQEADSTLLPVIWPNLEHYLADIDIRERDPAYREMQNTEMEKLVRLLRAGAPDSELAKVDFLGSSASWEGQPCGFKMTPHEVRASLLANEGKRVHVTYADGVVESVDVHSVDDEGFLHSGPGGVEPAHWWTRFDSVVHVADDEKPK